MFKIPMYTPVLFPAGTMLATIRYGTPTMLAQQMPRPIMGTSVKYWLLICDRAATPATPPPRPRQPACTRLPPKLHTERQEEQSSDHSDEVVGAVHTGHSSRPPPRTLGVVSAGPGVGKTDSPITDG